MFKKLWGPRWILTVILGLEKQGQKKPLSVISLVNPLVTASWFTKGGIQERARDSMINIWQDNQKRHSPSRFSWSSWDLEGTTSYSKVMSGQCMQNLQKYEESSFANLCLIKTVGKWRERKREDFYVRNFPNALWSFSLLGRKLLHPCFKPSEGGFKRPTLRAGHVSFGVWGTSMRHWLKISFRVAERMRKWGREAEQKREKGKSRARMNEYFSWANCG